MAYHPQTDSQVKRINQEVEAVKIIDGGLHFYFLFSLYFSFSFSFSFIFYF